MEDCTAIEERSRALTAERQRRLLLDSIRDYAIFMLDPNGFVQSWNAGGEAVLGYRASEVLGKHFTLFYTPQSVAEGVDKRELRNASKSGRTEEEGVRVRKDGSRFWANVVLSSIRDETGEIVGFAKVVRDLSERKAAEERIRLGEERLRLMIASVRDYAIFMLDPAGNIATWNEGAGRIKGYRPEEIIGQHMSRFYTEADVRANKPAQELEIAAREGRFEEEGYRVRKDGSQFWASVVISAMRHPQTGELIGFTKVTRDLTDQRKLQEDRVRLAQAQESLRLRDEFLSIASHELKTPLTALQLQLESLEGQVETLEARVQSKVKRARRSAQRLSDLVEMLLDVSRIATGRLEITRVPMDLAASAREVVEQFRETANQAGCALSFEGPSPVLGAWDRLRLEQVITNLLSNAVKYGAGQPVEVSVVRRGEKAVLRVRDHGPGIAAEDLERIFGRFERAVSMRHYGGMGLGLYVARQIVEAHGGKVLARNEEGGGAVFTVEVPVAAAARAASPKGAER